MGRAAQGGQRGGGRITSEESQGGWTGGQHGVGSRQVGSEEPISTFDGVDGADWREKGQRDSASVAPL